ncbi:CvpA family protein [bacterium]|nr:CvpA family protein [bacterium]MCP5461763.1 CvpA family protein [bacterium]
MSVEFSWIDVLIVLITIFFAIRGYKRGLSGELLSIITLFLSFLLAYHYFSFVAVRLERSIGLVPVIANIFGYIIVFVSVYIVCSAISFLIKKIMQWSFVAGLDKAGGVLFGVVRSICLVSVVLVLLGMLHMPSLSNRIAERSFLARYIMLVSPYIYETTFMLWRDSRNFDAQKFSNSIAEDSQRYRNQEKRGK